MIAASRNAASGLSSNKNLRVCKPGQLVEPAPPHTLRSACRRICSQRSSSSSSTRPAAALPPEAHRALYSLRRCAVGEARRRLEDPAAVNEPLYGGATILHTIAEQRDAGVVRALLPAALAAGADVGRPDAQGCSPLFYSANNRDPASAEAGLRLLLAAGADPGARAFAGLTPLHSAARNTSPEAAAVAIRLLACAGAPVEAALADSAGGKTPLAMAVAANDSPAAMEAAVASLLQAGAAVGAADNRGARPLHLAAQRCAVDGNPVAPVMRLLLAAGGAVGSLDGQGQSPLHLCMGSSAAAVEATQVLLAAGADPDLPCLPGGGWRPMHAAALLPDAAVAEQLVSLLLSAGARVDATDAGGNTPLMWLARGQHAAQGGEGAAPEAAAPAGGARAADESSCSSSSVAALVLKLVEAGADLEARDARGRTPLQLALAAAVESGGAHEATAMVQALLEAGADARPLLRRL